METSGIIEKIFIRHKKKYTMDLTTPSECMLEPQWALPPFESQMALLKSHCAKWKLMAWMGGLTTLGSMGTSTYLLRHELFQKMNSEYIVVPGAAEFLRVRPNLIPDSVVKDFAQYVATYAGNFTYRNAVDHFETVAERMAPELKGRFLRDAESKFSQWTKRRVDQVFAFEPIEIQLVNDSFGPKYVMVVTGKRSQYADGTLLQETDENLFLELRPRLSLNPGRRSDESLLLIERLEWVSLSQAEALLSRYAQRNQNP